MEPVVLLGIYSLAIIAVSLIGGSLPLIYRWSSSQLHMFTGLSAGFFIAAAFLILIPESAELMDAHEALALVMIGLVVVLLIERVILTHHHDEHHGEHDDEDDDDDDECEHTHALTSTTAFIGLAVHGIMDGFGPGRRRDTWRRRSAPIVFRRHPRSQRLRGPGAGHHFPPRQDTGAALRSGLAAVFSLIVPAAAFLAFPLIEVIENIEVGAPLALAAGTFLYVGICDLLPEAFHLEKRGYRAFLAVLFGIVVMYLVTQLAGHLH